MSGKQFERYIRIIEKDPNLKKKLQNPGKASYAISSINSQTFFYSHKSPEIFTNKTPFTKLQSHLAKPGKNMKYLDNKPRVL